MKKDIRKNFTKLTRSGISLMVLIITIIVLVILAATVILTISQNNPVSLAKEATFKEDMRTFQNQLNMAISEEYAQNPEKRKETITTSDFAKIQEYIPSVTEKYKGKIEIQRDEIVYVEENLTESEIKWLTDIEIYEKLLDAKTISEKPKSYYGQYVLNYSTDNEKTKDAVEKWRIFYSDGTNIYIIASDYIKGEYAPAGKKGSTLNKNGNYKVYFNNILSDYAGSADITDTRLQALNSSYFNYLTQNDVISTKSNMKAVAYMLDISDNVWGTFAGKNAEYAIGGPTLEILFNSYSQKYDVDYRAQVTSLSGYQISKDGGENWANLYSGMLTSSDSLYVISASDRKADSIWLASPSANLDIRVMGMNASGLVCGVLYNNSSYLALRPLVCLKSDVLLKKVEGGFEIQ